MAYQWEEIFKRKSDEELYDIYLGRSLLQEEVKVFAKQELERRNFNFDNIEKEKKKWRLRKLINEKEQDSIFAKPHINKEIEVLITAIVFSVLDVILFVNFFSDFIKTETSALPFHYNLVGFIFCSGIAVYCFYDFRRKRKDRMVREKEIDRLIDEF